MEARLAFGAGSHKIPRMYQSMARITVGVAAVAMALGSCTPKTPQYAIKYAEKRVKLESNGLRAVIIPDDTTELVEVDVRYEVGSNEDPPGKAGLAHLAEHMMFMLRPDGADTPPLMDFVGQYSTFFNAYTTWDQTHYMTQVRKEMLDAVLKIEAMRLYFGCESITEEEFLREREVVRNEIRQRSGAPEGQVWQLIHSVVYPEGHPYHRMIGGDDTQLTNISLVDACKFIADYYVPSRATLVIAGNVDVDETAKLISKWFGNLPNKQPAARAKVEPLVIDQQRRVDRELDIPRTQVVVAWALPPQYTPDGKYANFIAGQIGGQFGYFSSEWDFATDAGARISGGPHAPVLLVYAELKNDNGVNEALEFIWKSARSAHRPFEDGVFDESKLVMKGNQIAALEQLAARTGAVADMVQFDPDVEWDSEQEFLLKGLEDIDAIDGGAIRSAAQKLLDPGKAMVLVIHAKEGAKSLQERADVEFSAKTHEKREVENVDPQEAYRPLMVSTELDSMRSARRFELGNGMKVVLLPFATMPIVSAQLVFGVGGAHEDPARAGLASMAARGIRPSANPMSQVGIQWGGGAGDDFTTFSARGINIYLEVMIKGLERLIVTGDYSQEGLEDWQKGVREQFERQSYRDNFEFNRQLYSTVFGPNHPYTTNGSPNPTSIGRINRDAVMDFKRKHYSARNATLVIAGNFDPDEAESLVRDNFGGWGGGHEDQPVAAAPKPRSGPEYIGVIGRKLPQMQIAIAYPAPAGIDDKQAARMVLQVMLNERMGALRHELGSTYGVYARKTTSIGPTMYQMGGTVDAARAGESLAAMRAGVDKLRAGDGFEEDFVKARRSIVQKLLGQSTVSAEVADRLAQIEKYGLPDDYYTQLLQKVATVTPDEVKALLEAELRPELEVVVTMADRETLEAAFTEAGLADFKLVEPKLD